MHKKIPYLLKSQTVVDGVTLLQTSFQYIFLT